MGCLGREATEADESGKGVTVREIPDNRKVTIGNPVGVITRITELTRFINSVNFLGIEIKVYKQG